MRNSKTLCVAAMIASIVVLLATVTTVEAQWWAEGGRYYNFDANNDTGQAANDFHVGLTGVSKDQVSDYYTEDYGSAEESNTEDGMEIDFEDGDTDPNHVAHFGFALAAGAEYTDMETYWTKDGTKIGSNTKKIYPDWDSDYSLDILHSLIHNQFSGGPLWIQRRVNTSTTPMTVSQLLVGGSLWNTGTVIDPLPISVPFCNTVTYDFDVTPGTPNYVMMYDVYADSVGAPGPLLLTHLSAVTIVPEPGTVAMLIGLAGFILFGYHRRK